MPFPVRRPVHGPSFDDLVEGEVHVHPRAFTVPAAFAQEFATAFMDANPLHLSEAHAKRCGFDRLVVPPLLTLNLALSMGVQNDSERYGTHLGVTGAEFFRPVLADDTLRSMTKVLAKKDRGPGKPGVAALRTAAHNQRGELVLQYDRAVLVESAGGHAAAHHVGEASSSLALPIPGLVSERDFPPNADRTLRLPRAQEYPPLAAAGRTFLEDLTPGEVIVHASGRTVTDEHIPWTYRVGNTHPLHFDALFAGQREGKVGGAPVVFGGFVHAWAAGLASRDTTENALFDLSYAHGAHTAPVFSGDTISALTRVLSVGPAPFEIDGAGVAVLQLVAVKNRRAGLALDRHGEALFRREAERRASGEPLPEGKVFEIERTVLIRRRPGR